MTGRVRKPTARALDAAQSRLLASSVPPDRKQSAAAVKRNGRAVNAKGKTAVKKDQQRDQLVDEEEEDQVEEEQPQDDQQDLTLCKSANYAYTLVAHRLIVNLGTKIDCVCLGYDTGEEAMIQCEHCSNWLVLPPRFSLSSQTS